MIDQKELKEPGYFRKRGNTWSFTVDMGRDMLTRKRLQKTVTGFASQEDAKAACKKYLLNLEEGKRTKEITLEEFIIEYLENVVKFQVEDSTYVSQWQWARDYVIPILGKHPIINLKHKHIVAFYNRLLKDGESRGLIKNIAMVLSKTLKAAVIEEIVLVNVSAHASVPKYEPKKIKIWTPEEMKDFIVRSEWSWLHVLYVLALTTGMRIGEMLALNWSDIDFTKNVVEIDKTLKYTVEKGLFIKDPKTKNSFRSITIPKLTIVKLQALRDTQPKGQLLVFDDDGRYVRPTEASRYFQNVCKKLDMPKIRFHEMRHTHASHMLRKHSIKVVAERLGDTPGTVLKTYAHVLPGMQQEVADGIDEDF